MVHYFSMVLVLWALITQPLMAMTPVKIVMNNDPAIHRIQDASEVTTVVRSGSYEQLSMDHGNVKSDDALLSRSTMRCHEMGAAVTSDKVRSSSTKHCDHCQSSHCASGCTTSSACATSCSATGIFVTLVSSLNSAFTDLQSFRFPNHSSLLLSRLPPRIFHPPKLA